MKPAPFEYQAPASVEEALNVLMERGEEAKLLAGGQSLIPAMNFRVVQPALLVDLNRLEELRYLRAENGSLSVGAMTTQRQLERDPSVAGHVPLLAQALPYIAHPQIRNRGTLGGSLVHADPAAELPVVAVAARARIHARSTEGERWIPAESFFQGMFVTDLAPTEMLVEVEFPASPPATGWSFQEVSRRRGDYAMMGVAAMVSLSNAGDCTEARLVYLNAGDGPVQAGRAAEALVGRSLSETVIEEAARIAAEQEIDPLGNVHASVSYQRHLARVLTERALSEAVGRAQQAGGSRASA
jgi:carbon-monoxide dehydrogenase medium subunit